MGPNAKRLTNLSLMTWRFLLPLLSIVLLDPARAGVAEQTAGAGEFPALQLLPPGSVVRGISLPRYENHRVTATLTADCLEILSRHEARMKNICSVLYGANEETTQVKMPGARYNFRTELLSSRKGPVQLIHPRYRVQASGIILHSASHCGVLTGPVRTILRHSATTRP